MWQCGKWFVCSFGEHCEEVLSFLVILHHKVLIDEASQATETATLVPICHGCKQLVLCGDHCQLPQWKASRPTQQGLRCPCSKGWPCMVCGRSCWTRSALEQGKSCCCMRAHKAVPSHLNLCVNICIIMYYILRPCIHFTYWQICKCIHL